MLFIIRSLYMSGYLGNEWKPFCEFPGVVKIAVSLSLLLFFCSLGFAEIRCRTPILPAYVKSFVVTSSVPVATALCFCLLDNDKSGKPVVAWDSRAVIGALKRFYMSHERPCLLIFVRDILIVVISSTYQHRFTLTKGAEVVS